MNAALRKPNLAAAHPRYWRGSRTRTCLQASEGVHFLAAAFQIRSETEDLTSENRNLRAQAHREQPQLH
jgi:hypothetical protein